MLRKCILFFLVVLSTKVSADAVSGSWTNTASWPFIPIHAVNLPDGRVLTYGGTTIGQGGQINYDIWDPSLGLGASSHLTLPNTTAVDTFCSAMLLMPQTGNVLTMSGDSNGGRNRIIRNQDVNAYDYRTESVRRLDRGINRQRWYGTPVMTGKGEVFLQAGTCWGNSQGPCPVRLGTTPEIYRPGNGWNYLSNISGSLAEYAFGESNGMRQWWYPRSWLMGNGDIYTLSGGRVQVTMSTEGSGSIVQHDTLNEDNFGATNSGVMYRPDKLLITGGGGADSNGREWDGRDQATLIDLTSGVPHKTVARPMSAGRQWHNSTVLPDGTVLVTGGSTRNNTLDGVTNHAEIWDPDTDTWTVGAEGPAARLYHSVALLLQDGRVFTGGGGAPGPRTGVDGEVYSPPYLFKPGMQNRLSITSGPSVMEASNSYSLSVSGAPRVSRVTMVGYGGATHSFNMGQRFVELNFNVQSNGTVQIMTPSNANHVPPGYYMIYVLDADGVPSVAHTARVFPSDISASPDEEVQQSVSGERKTSFEFNQVPNGSFGVLSHYENWTSAKGIEVWKNHKDYSAADGDSWIEVDVTGANALNATYATQANTVYTLTFSASPRPGVSANSNSFEVFWNGQLLDNIAEDGTTLTALNWRRYTYSVNGTGSDTLSIREYDSDGVGAMLDDVRLSANSSSTPAPTSLATSFENNTLSNGAYAVLPNYENWSGTKGVEVWRNHRGYSAAEGNSWIEVDVSGASTTNATYATQANTLYTLSFFSSPRPGVSASSNSFEVFWNGQLIDNIAEDGTRLTALNWQRHTYTVNGTGNDTLSFREYDSDGLGALLDDVRFSSDLTPRPAPVTLATSFENNTLSNGAYAVLPNYENWSGTKGIELWRNHRGYSAADGDSWIEVDVSGASTTNATYATQANTPYTLTFSSSPRPGVPASSNSFDVFWNGQLLDTIAEEGSRLTALDWQRYAYSVTGTGSDTLSVREYDSDGVGALLDYVRLSVDLNPTPAPVTIATSFENNTLSNGAYAILPSYENWSGTKGIEVWRNHRGYIAAEGNSWIEVDVNGASTVNATYATQANTPYTLTFSSSPRPGVSASSNSFDVFWNGQQLDTIAVDGTRLSALNWQTYTYSVNGTGNDSLSLREYDTDGSGALLDNVSLTPNPALAPALSAETGVTAGGGGGGAVGFGMIFWLVCLSAYRRFISNGPGTRLWINHQNAIIHS